MRTASAIRAAVGQLTSSRGGGLPVPLVQAPNRPKSATSRPHQIQKNEAAPVAAERRRDADPPPPAAREQVDRRREERQQHRDQHDLDRPAADDPLSEIDVARRPRGQRDALLHRVERVLHGAPDLLEPAHVEISDRVAGSARRAIGRRRDRHRRNAARDERRLLVEAERESEVDQLAQRTGPTGLHTGLLRQHRPGGLDESRLRRARRVAGELEPRSSASRDRVEVQHRRHVRRLQRVSRELRRADPAVRAAVGREEEERIRKLQSRRARLRRVGPRELDQCRRAGGVVVRARPDPRVVAVRHHHDRPPRSSRLHRDEVREPDACRDRGSSP